MPVTATATTPVPSASTPGLAQARFVRSALSLALARHLRNFLSGVVFCLRLAPHMPKRSLCRARPPRVSPSLSASVFPSNDSPSWSGGVEASLGTAVGAVKSMSIPLALSSTEWSLEMGSVVADEGREGGCEGVSRFFHPTFPSVPFTVLLASPPPHIRSSPPPQDSSFTPVHSIPWYLYARLHYPSLRPLPTHSSLPAPLRDCHINDSLTFISVVLVEDRLNRRRQRDIPRILEALIAFLVAIEDAQAQLRPPPHAQPAKSNTSGRKWKWAAARDANGRGRADWGAGYSGGQLWLGWRAMRITRGERRRHVDAEEQANLAEARAVLREALDALTDGLSRITRTFGDKLGVFRFVPRTVTAVRGFANLRRIVKANDKEKRRLERQILGRRTRAKKGDRVGRLEVMKYVAFQ
ncbi:hypothetical protein C8F04DRAFT_1188238 [Mycena alexandri]|uniref:Uncharacterized protein n=1 Tax=Mycena alexandri TaxID=1745969 RepID=A0AAD6SJX7_9AGAR|nr:hypothetical protein C8F04DRAFT_1188238 [Mycena alexandri]